MSASSASVGFSSTILKTCRSFLAAGFLYVLTGPSLWLAQVLLYGYVLSRFLHFGAYLTAQAHEVRATFWTIGSVILIFMAGETRWWPWVTRHPARENPAAPRTRCAISRQTGLVDTLQDLLSIAAT